MIKEIPYSYHPKTEGALLEKVKGFFEFNIIASDAGPHLKAGIFWRAEWKRLSGSQVEMSHAKTQGCLVLHQLYEQLLEVL